MPSFQVKSGSRTLTLEMTGVVTEGGAAAGSWTTNLSNQVDISFAGATGAGPVNLVVDVTWAFDAATNHLVVTQPNQNGTYDFNGQPGLKPLLRTVDSVLFVNPDRSGTFEFALRPKWNLTTGHDMEVTIAGTTSKIDGFVFDNFGRFRYHFFDKSNLLNESVLGFKGEWVNEPTGNQPGIVQFQYDLEAAGQKGTFELPKGLVVDKALNQLAYVYDKAGHTLKMQLVGTFTFRNLELTYAVERSQDSDGKSTTLRFGAVLNTKNASATLDFALTNKTGAVTSTTLSLSGVFTSQFKNGRLDVGFRFLQQRAAGTVTNTLLFTGQLTHKNGVFAWSIEMNGKIMTIGISAQQIQIGDARAQGGLNFVLDNGKVAGVRALFGVSF